ncbi:hypothetical protein ASE75_11520 [Sphingomonas sp. Leaf17]|uniref:hypothetical protein n=1 Tax=Sphingomonas sp. Leaf17 TaxID=1735683 RepID=UPI0006FE94C6|nr:hypothetical protein [Sphingomonas sp. Leaf17]KQM63719.1 hypothetical protein ASE75_11520 [Sphingomonas sp. Leaf17]
MYAITTDHARHIVHVQISGFWSEDMLAPFSAELKAAVDSLRLAPGQHLVLIDVSDVAIQSQPVVAAFQKLIVHGPTRARRMALYTTQMLPRMQARRIAAVREDGSVFGSRAEAEAWLLAPDAAASAPISGAPVTTDN